MQSSPHAFESDTTDPNPNSFSRFYHHPNDRMLFDPMPFGPAGYRPDMSFGMVSERMPFQGHDPYLNSYSHIRQQSSFPPRPTQVPIKRMDSSSPSPTWQPADGNGQRENTEPVVYNIPIRVEGRDDVSPAAPPAAPVREIPPERRPQSPQYQRTEQQIPIHVKDGTGARQLRPGVSASRQRSATPEVKRQDEGVRPVPVQTETSKPRDRSASPPPVQKKKKTPQEHIDEANERLKELRAEVDKFTGTSTDKQYRYLDEMLTRLLISLDTVDTEGDEKLRLARKQTIRDIQHCADALESKAAATQQAPDSQNSDMQQPEPNTGSAAQENQQQPEQVVSEEAGNSEQAMETEADVPQLDEDTSTTAEQEPTKPESNDSRL